MNTPTTRCRRRLLPALALCAFMALPATAHAFETVEELLERSEQEGNAEELAETLAALRRQPLPVNRATESELLRIPLLSAADAHRIVVIRERDGAFDGAASLAGAIGPDNAARIAPYLSFDLPRAAAGKRDRAIRGSVYARFSREIPERQGIVTGKYEGENRKLFGKIELSGSNFGAAVVQESDIGEPDTADFRSFTVHADRIGILKTAVAGNYRLSFGQGLLLGQGRYFSKGSDPVDGVLIFSPSVRPFASSSEYGFMQGAAATFNPGRFELTAFTSRNLHDATLKDGVATSANEDGYHRTAAEQEKKDRLKLEARGMNVRYRFGSGRLAGGIGGTMLNYRYGLPVAWLDGDRQERSAASVEAGLVYGRVQVFGEAAFSHDPEAASWICGLQATLAERVTGVASVRHYAVGYYSPFAGAFAERGDDGSNEDGFYFGVNARAFDNLELGISCDVFRFPELASTYALPSSGHDARLNATWKQGRRLTWSMLYQHREKEETKIQTEDGGWREYVMPVPKTTSRLQLNLEVQASPAIALRTRGEYKSVESRFESGVENERGWLCYQQLRSNLGRLAITTRYTRFRTDSYDAAVYAYEDDLPQLYSLTPYWGRGQAAFILAGYRPSDNFMLAGKYEITWFADRESYGTGNDLRATSSPAVFSLGAMLKF
jgi:hypothetical protein